MRADYSTYGCFRAVDRLNEGAITFQNLKNFFTNAHIFLTDRQITCIVRRMDTDGDA
jgi:Ca2+-binding EF-hand superfamily protein